MSQRTLEREAATDWQAADAGPQLRNTSSEIEDDSRAEEMIGKTLFASGPFSHFNWSHTNANSEHASPDIRDLDTNLVTGITVSADMLSIDMALPRDYETLHANEL
ncbi:MAG: hypothetical protein AAF709_15180 [Pseudomonadota bacterium]